MLCVQCFCFLVVSNLLFEDCLCDLCVFPFLHLTEGRDRWLVSANSQVIKSSEVGSSVHSKPFAFTFFDFMFHDISDYGFKKFDFLVKCVLGEDRDVTEVPLFILRTSWLLPFFFQLFWWLRGLFDAALFRFCFPLCHRG